MNVLINKIIGIADEQIMFISTKNGTYIKPAIIIEVNDVTPPVVTWTESSLKYDSSKYYPEATITANAIDSIDGVLIPIIKAGGKTYENGFTFIKSGIYSCVASSTDNSGNIGKTTSLTIRIQSEIKVFLDMMNATDEYTSKTEFQAIMDYYSSLSDTVKRNCVTNDDFNLAYNLLLDKLVNRIMTVKIDLSNSDPATCCSYADDAVGITAGSTDWDKFFGHYPVMFKDGKEVGKLNPNDFTKFVDGTTADITSGDAGDVMIAFPRRGLKIETVGNIMTVSMTDDPNNPNFEYLAHTKGSVYKDKFYLGAYKGYLDGTKLRSISGKTPTATQTIGTFRTQAQANGAGYEQSSFYQLMFRQAMYLLKYKNLNSQVAVGRGYVDGNSAAIATGGTNAKGMDFGETTGKLQMKLFGLEDFWGNIWEWIDGIVTNSTRNILTVTNSFNDSGSGYTDRGQGATANIGNYMSKPQGATQTGFLAKEVTGSETTYFCDYAALYDSCVAYFGGHWGNVSHAGAFCLNVNHFSSASAASIAARLMYL